MFGGVHGNHIEARERQYLSIYCLLLDILSQNCWAVGDVGGMGTTLRPVESHGLHCVAASSRSPSVPSSLPRPFSTETPPPIIFCQRTEFRQIFGQIINQVLCYQLPLQITQNQNYFKEKKRRLVHNFQLSPACSRHKRREQRDIKSCKTNKNLWRNTGPL